MTQVEVLAPASVAFPSLKSDLATLESLIRGLSRTDVLFWCCRLNLVVSNPDAVDVQRWAVGKFFGDAEVRRLNEFTKRHGGIGLVRIVCRAQLLELFRWTCLFGADRGGDGQTFRVPTVRKRFAQALSVAGDIWMDRTYALRLGDGEDLAGERQRSMSTLRNAMRANTPTTDLYRSLARASVMCDDEFPKWYPNVDGAFREMSGLGMSEYSAFAAALLSHFAMLTPATAEKTPGLFRRHDVGDALAPQAAAAIPHFLDLEAARPDAFRDRFLLPSGRVPSPTDPFDLRPFWDHPILEAQDGRSIVIDPHILSEKMVLGPAFHLASHARGKTGCDALGALGRAFEGYVITLLQGMSRPVIANPTRPSANGLVELTDAAVVIDDAVLLFEAKSVFIPEKIALGDDSEAYAVELRKKYVETTGRGGTSAQGVGQLAGAVARIAVDDFVDAPGDLQTVRRILPVLVVRDPSIAVLGHLELLAQAFEDALRAQTQNREVGRFALAPLTVMSIDDLELLAPSAVNFSLAEFLSDYYSRPFEGARPSLRDFMVEYQARYKISQGGFLAGIGHEKMKAVGRYLYGRDS